MRTPQELSKSRKLMRLGFLSNFLKVAALLQVFLACVYSTAALADCDGATISRMIGAGFSRGEILKLCGGSTQSSGPRFSTEPNYDYLGGDLPQNGGVLFNMSLLGCVKACSLIPECTAFTFGPADYPQKELYGGDGNFPLCWLKGNGYRRVWSPGLVGVRISR